MAIVQCVSCENTMKENEDEAILSCPECGCTIIRVLEDDNY